MKKNHHHLSQIKSNISGSMLDVSLLLIAGGLLFSWIEARGTAPVYAQHSAIVSILLALVARPMRSRLLTRASAARTIQKQRRPELAHSHLQRPSTESAGPRVLHLSLPIKSNRFRPANRRIAVLGSTRKMSVRRSERLIAFYGHLCRDVKVMSVDQGHSTLMDTRAVRHDTLVRVLLDHLKSVVVEHSVSTTKRGLDVLLSLLFLLVLAPLLVALALCVKVSSPGPILYRHTRIGRNGKKFCMWKFRSMYLHGDQLFERCMDSDPALREEWLQHRKLRYDPRVTTLGRLLRRTSMDELPQLWNVLVGDMSLVGPRPIVDAEVPLYADHFCAYKHVRPGMTGLWQVSGRNHNSYKQRVLLDRTYAENWTVWLDFKILWRTWHVVLKGDGAY